MTRTLPDGDTIEVRGSGNGNPPGVGGQATAKSTVWIRINGGEWVYCGRSMHRCVMAAECADSVKEFWELLEIL